MVKNSADDEVQSQESPVTPNVLSEQDNTDTVGDELSDTNHQECIGIRPISPLSNVENNRVLVYVNINSIDIQTLHQNFVINNHDSFQFVVQYPTKCKLPVSHLSDDIGVKFIICGFPVTVYYGSFCKQDIYEHIKMSKVRDAYMVNPSQPHHFPTNSSPTRISSC